MSSPDRRSIQHFFRNNLLVFITTIFLIVVFTSFIITTVFALRSSFALMVARSKAATIQISDFNTEMEKVLLTFEGREDLFDGAKLERRALSRLYSQTEGYDQILLVSRNQDITDSFPPTNTELILTEQEVKMAGKAIAEGTRELILNRGPDNRLEMSIILPVLGSNSHSDMALIGRVKESALIHVLADLTIMNSNSTSAIVDMDGKSIVKAGPASDYWYGSDLSQFMPFILPDNFGGKIYFGENALGAYQLMYITPSSNYDWRVAVSSPLTNILKQGVFATSLLGSVFLVIAGFFFASMNKYAGGLSRSIIDLSEASQRFMFNGIPSIVNGNDREDELGELRRSVDEMQRSVKKRLDEQSLLLSISLESSTSFELADSIPDVLQGVLRGTGASGVRVLVLNPGGGKPVVYTDGPAAESMKKLDGQLLSMMRQEEELILLSPQAISEKLVVHPLNDLQVKALCILPLQVESKFLGFLAVGFRNQQEISTSNRSFLQFIARRASILVQNSFLYTFAEGGRKRLTAVLDSTSEAVIVTDPTARILRINRALEQAFDLEAQRVVGRKIADVFDSPALVSALTSGVVDSRDLEIQGKDGCTYFANTSLIVSHDRKALGRVAVLHDVTHLKEIDRLKSEFIDNVSHDLRTPLTILSGYASALALVDDLTVEQREYADNILHSVERMVELVEDLLDLGRIEAGVDLVFEYIDIGHLLQDIADEHWLYAHESGIHLKVRTAENLPLVYCDRRLLRRAISNLLMNGFKYAPNSGDMTLTATLTEKNLTISVHDRGPGIAREDQLRLFEKFYRVNRHEAGAVKGTGLGLAIVKSVADKHEGRCWCESAKGKGSTFYISLPLEGKDVPLPYNS